MKRIGIAVVLAVLTGAPGAAFGTEPGRSLVETVVEKAQTPEEHAALASHYRDKAEQARAAAARHERMAQSYMRGNLAHRERMKRHCDSIVQKYEGMAQDYDALADTHGEASNTGE